MTNFIGYKKKKLSMLKSEKITLLILISLLVISLINTVLLLNYCILSEDFKKVVIVDFQNMTITKLDKGEVILILTWTITEGHYLPTMPKRLVTDKGAILEIMQKIDFPKSVKFEPSTVVKRYVKARIISGKVSIGDKVRPPSDIITIPEASLPTGIVILTG